jgi:hypothetical protein
LLKSICAQKPQFSVVKQKEQQRGGEGEKKKKKKKKKKFQLLNSHFLFLFLFDYVSYAGDVKSHADAGAPLAFALTKSAAASSKTINAIMFF